MNRGEFRQAVKDRLAIPASGDARLPDATLNGYIDEALAVLHRERDWPWMLTSISMNWSAGNPSLGLPADFLRARRLLVAGRVVEEVQFDELLDDRGANRCRWAVVGTTARLAPTNTSAVVGDLWYYQAPAALTSDLSVPKLPVVHHGTIVHYAAHLANLTRQDSKRAEESLSLYRQALMAVHNDANRSTGPRRVRVTSDLPSTYATWPS